MNIKYKSVVYLYLTIATLIFLTPSTSYAQNTYSVGVQNFEHYHPYSEYINNTYSGFNRELLDMFAQSQGFTFIYKARPIKRLYSEFLNENFDFKYPDNARWAADIKGEKQIYYSQAVVNYHDGLMVKKENQGKPFAELKRISVINGFTPAKPYVVAYQKGELKFIYTTDYQRLLDLVSEGRVDGAYFDIVISEHHISHSINNNNNLVFDESLPFISGTRSLSSIRYPELISAFDKFLLENKEKIDLLKLRYNLLKGSTIPHQHTYAH